MGTVSTSISSIVSDCARSRTLPAKKRQGHAAISRHKRWPPVRRQVSEALTFCTMGSARIQKPGWLHMSVKPVCQCESSGGAAPRSRVSMRNVSESPSWHHHCPSPTLLPWIAQGSRCLTLIRQALLALDRLPDLKDCPGVRPCRPALHGEIEISAKTRNNLQRKIWAALSAFFNIIPSLFCRS